MRSVGVRDGVWERVALRIAGMGETDVEASPPLLPESPARRPRRSQEASDPRRALVLWLGVTLCTVLLFVGVVTVLNLTVYSASGFVDRYLAALDRRDIATLVELPGVSIPDGADLTAISRSGMAAVDEARVVGESSTDGGVTAVTVDWRDAEQSGNVVLLVERSSAIAGVFSGWRFAESPTEIVQVTVAHAAQFEVNGTAVTAVDSGSASVTAPIAAFVPSSLALDLDARYLTATPVTVVADGTQPAVTVEARANDDFIQTVQKQLDEFLDGCADQQVLLPSGCPFGTFIEDRLAAPPSWSIVQHPTVTIEPGEPIGVWLVPASPAVAHVSADVISLFDGSTSPLDEDVPFDVSYRIEISEEGSLRIAGS